MTDHTEPTNEELAKRLRELSKAVTEGPEGWHREFTMRIPAEPKRDADLVLQCAAARLEAPILEESLVDRLKDAGANFRYGDFTGSVSAEFWKLLLTDILAALEQNHER